MCVGVNHSPLQFCHLYFSFKMISVTSPRCRRKREELPVAALYTQDVDWLHVPADGCSKLIHVLDLFLTDVSERYDSKASMSASQALHFLPYLFF